MKKLAVAFALAFAVIVGAAAVSIATGTPAVAGDDCCKDKAPP
jgi:hypothetical protein